MSQDPTDRKPTDQQDDGGQPAPETQPDPTPEPDVTPQQRTDDEEDAEGDAAPGGNV